MSSWPESSAYYRVPAGARPRRDRRAALRRGFAWLLRHAVYAGILAVLIFWLLYDPIAFALIAGSIATLFAVGWAFSEGAR